MKKYRYYSFALLIGILCLLMFYILTSRKTDQTDQLSVADDKTPQPASQSAQQDWLIFRGNSGLWGNSPTKFTNHLTLKWKFTTDDAITSSAVVKGDLVFVGSTDNHLYCLNIHTGKKIWSFETEDAIEASPTVSNDTVYVGSADGFLYALNISDGQLKWKFQTDDKIMGAPNIFQATPDAEPAILVGSYDSFLYCLNVQGKELWRYETDNYINGTASIDSGQITFGGCDGILHVLSAHDGKLLRQIEIESYIAGSAALDGDRAYLGHYGNDFLCANTNTGEIVWKYHDRNFPIFASPALTENRVVFGSRDKRLHCLDRQTGLPVWTFKTRGKVDSSPVICHNKVIFGSDDGRLYMVSLTDGELIWSYEIGDALKASPAIVEGYVVIGSEDGVLYAFVN